MLAGIVEAPKLSLIPPLAAFAVTDVALATTLC